MFDNKVSIEYMAVSMPINEDFYEQVIIEHLRDDLGYEFLHGPDVPRTTPDYRDVFLPVVLPASLKRINPGLPDVAIEQAILKIPEVTFVELLTNAMLHKEYDRRQYVGMYAYEDTGKPVPPRPRRIWPTST